MKRVKSFFESSRTTIIFLNIALLLIILFMLAQTNHVWGSILRRVYQIFLPFLVGFIVAYFLAPLTARLQRLGIRKSLSILIVCFAIIGVVVFLFVYMGPQVYRLASEFYVQYRQKFDFGIIDFVKETFGFDLTPIYNYATDYIETMLTDFRVYVELNLPGIISRVISITVTAIFGIAVALYLLADNGSFRANLFKFGKKINKDADIYIITVDREIRSYFKGMFLICLERMVEYGIIYAALGSKHFLFLGLIHGVGVFVPYIGGIAGSFLGVISLMMAHDGNWPLILFCFLVLIVLQYVDEYFIAPKILAKSTKMNPLWILFAIFAGGSILGFFGIVIALPVFIAVSVAIKTYHKLKHNLKIEQENSKI